MKLDFLASHDFMIVASVLLLSALFNKTLINIIGAYEAFATAADDQNMTAASFIQQDTWMNFFKSKAFWFPSIYAMIGILILFIWLITYLVKFAKNLKSPSYV